MQPELIKREYDDLNSILLEISEQRKELKTDLEMFKDSRVTFEQTLLALEDERENPKRSWRQW